MKTGTTTLTKEGPSSLGESQRLINDDSAAGIKNFKLLETTVGFSFRMPFATMLATDAVVLDVRTIS
jgi:hypothetical protein